jgi:hypothetical protein
MQWDRVNTAAKVESVTQYARHQLVASARSLFCCEHRLAIVFLCTRIFSFGVSLSQAAHSCFTRNTFDPPCCANKPLERTPASLYTYMHMQALRTTFRSQHPRRGVFCENERGGVVRKHARSQFVPVIIAARGRENNLFTHNLAVPLMTIIGVTQPAVH